MLRLNTAIKPSHKPSIYGLLGGDLAGFPNGRRVFDDVVAIELRAIAGVTYSLIDKSYTPDAAAGALTDGLTQPTWTCPTCGTSPTWACRTAASPRPRSKPRARAGAASRRRHWPYPR